jgi:hypothetical protein
MIDLSLFKVLGWQNLLFQSSNYTVLQYFGGFPIIFGCLVRFQFKVYEVQMISK